MVRSNRPAQAICAPPVASARRSSRRTVMRTWLPWRCTLPSSRKSRSSCCQAALVSGVPLSVASDVLATSVIQRNRDRAVVISSARPIDRSASSARCARRGMTPSRAVLRAMARGGGTAGSASSASNAGLGPGGRAMRLRSKASNAAARSPRSRRAWISRRQTASCVGSTARACSAAAITLAGSAVPSNMVAALAARWRFRRLRCASRNASNAGSSPDRSSSKRIGLLRGGSARPRSTDRAVASKARSDRVARSTGRPKVARLS